MLQVNSKKIYKKNSAGQGITNEILKIGMPKILTLCVRETLKLVILHIVKTRIKRLIMHNAAFHQGLHSLSRLKRSSDKKKIQYFFYLFFNYNLTPLYMYTGLSQVCCIKEEGRIH